MSTFEVDAVVTVEARDEDEAANFVVENLQEQGAIKEIEVVHVMDTDTYGK